MKNLTISLPPVLIGLFALVLLQCSSSKKYVVGAAPDVSQIPTSSETVDKNEKKTPGDAVVMMSSPAFYIKADTSGRYDSVQSKPKALTSTPRILHISASDFSIYDTPFDSVINRARQEKRSNPLDSTNHDYDVDVGILSPSAVENLTLNLAKTEIVALSVVSKELFEDFEKMDLEKKFAQYGAKYVLLAVSRTDSKQRSTFMINFFKERMSEPDVGKAFDKALASSINEVRKRRETLDFKARLIKNK